MDTLLRKVVKDISQACRCPKIVRDVLSDRFEHGHVTNLDPATDVLLQNLPDNGPDVGTLIDERLVSERLGKAALQDVSIELYHGIGVDRLAEKYLHVLVFLEGERLHLELDVATGQLGHELARKQVAVRAGDEDGPTPIGAKGVHNLLVAPHVLNLVNEQVFQSVRCAGGSTFDRCLELVSSLDLPQLATVEIEVDDGSRADATLDKLLGNGLHKTGLSAAPHAGDDLYDLVIMIEAPNLPEIVLTPE